MWVIAESITAGLIISLFNKYILNKNIFESCISERVDEDDDNNTISSVSASLSDSSSIHHIHV